jgi:hypothetical protein
MDQIRSNVTLIDGLLAPRRGFAGFIRRQVLPPTSFVATAYGLERDARLQGAAHRLLDAAKTLVRYERALRRLHGGRSWSPRPPGPASPADQRRQAKIGSTEPYARSP